MTIVTILPRAQDRLTRSYYAVQHHEHILASFNAIFRRRWERPYLEHVVQLLSISSVADLIHHALQAIKGLAGDTRTALSLQLSDAA